LFVQQSGYLPGTITGANVSLHALCRRLIAQDIAPIVVCSPDPPAIPCIDPGEPPGYTVLRTSDPVAAMHEVNATAAPAAIVVRAPDPAEHAARTASALCRPLHIYLESGFFGRSFPSPREAPHLRYAANSPFLARMGEAYLAAPVRYVPPLIEPEHYRCTPSGDAILFVNPVATKGVHIALAIAARLPHRRFVFVRSWPNHPNFPHFAVTLPNVELAASALDMRPLYARAKLVLMPSVWEESLGRVVNEAQISGIPAVASDRGGLRENVGRGGVILSLADPIERWCEAIERLFTDPAHYRRMTDGAHAEAQRWDCQPEAAVRRFLEFVSA
jgi:glycosyltransferase involved in cell wall biosynthesis